MGYTEINTACDLCVFKCDSCEECEFEFLRKYLSSKRVPDDCPRKIPRSANWKGWCKARQSRHPRPPNTFELQVLEVFQSHPSSFGFKRHQVVNLLNGHKAGGYNSKYINANTAKRTTNAIRFLQGRGFLRISGGRWFLPEARGVAESNPLRAARGA